MAIINFKDVQYATELHYFNKLKPAFSKLSNNNAGLKERAHRLEEEFYRLLSHSIRIDDFDNIKKLIDRIQIQLDKSLDLNIFLFQSPAPSAMCLPRYSYTEGSDEKLIILVSQHFINDLNEAEQITILGHELGHLLYGHVHIPAKALLKEDLPIEDVGNVKSEVLKWSTCCEISCDILSFVLNGFNADAFATAMIKMTTGLIDSSINKMDKDLLISKIITQCDELSDSVYEGVLSTHPLTPLRLRIINEIKENEFIKNFGQTMFDDDYDKLKTEFNQGVDDALCNIYPEIIPNSHIINHKSLYKLCLAVAMADGKIDDAELTAVSEIINYEYDEKNKQELLNEIRANDFNTLISDYLHDAIMYCENAKLRKYEIINIVKQLIIISASDNRIEKSELDVIYAYSKNFGIEKNEIIFLINQLELN